jgi:hypothetical protein
LVAYGVPKQLVKLKLTNPYFFKSLKQTKYEKLWGLKIRKNLRHFFQAFCSLDMIILFKFFLCCVVASKVQKNIVDLSLAHS